LLCDTRRYQSHANRSGRPRPFLAGPIAKPGEAMKRVNSTSLFTRFAKATSRVAGRQVAFSVAVWALLIWACSGPFFGFSDTWQLVINTGTTIVTFLMVFLIQNTQNRDSEALHVKLDELI